MLVVLRFTSASAEFPAQARQVLDLLAGREGFLSGRLARATDDAAVWLVVMEWANVGSWRRALSSYDVKMTATTLLGSADGGPSAFEVLYDCSRGESASDRASDG